MYIAQRWTGGIAFIYIVWHTYTMRFSGVDLHQYPVRRLAKCRAKFSHGLFLFNDRSDLRLLALRLRHLVFCASGESFPAKRPSGRFLACAYIFVLLSGVGLGSLTKLRSFPSTHNRRAQA